MKRESWPLRKFIKFNVKYLRSKLDEHNIEVEWVNRF